MGLYDRDYMRAGPSDRERAWEGDRPPRRKTVVVVMAVIMIVIVVITFVI